ncbi:hypothetical protein EDD76_105219 [Kineothrix alysoides]|uniref:Uncharacterized protein n=1 Tax=Kineothrix alysoides TaxID=1469948 RepID=A0A4R1R156_9FIRM|nr:hypothetical protein [Kineothrix alysoides]TCL59043.1 hypothetical protein EDD76_105219 [Kineothrix alysoides]
MEQDTKNKNGAPSSDTTSALFVSARKKQLEQQEAERRAKEKEDQRLAAEAEVQRLEQEVLERKRKAEEEARQVEEGAHTKKEKAAANPDTVLGTPSKKGKGINKALLNKKLFIIGGAAAAVLIVVIIVAVVIGTRPKEVTIANAEAGAIITLEDMGGAPAGMQRFSDDTIGLAFTYPSQWIAEFYKAGGGNPQCDFVLVAPESEQQTLIMNCNYSAKYNSYIDGGGTDGNALVEALIVDSGLLAHYKMSDLLDLEYLPVQQNVDGSIQYNAIWSFSSGASGFAALAVYEDRSVAAGTVVVTVGEDDTKYIDVIIGSVEVW